MGKLAERRAERGAITKRYDAEKARIHVEYMQALRDLDKRHNSMQSLLRVRYRASLNKALAMVDAGEV